MKRMKRPSWYWVAVIYLHEVKVNHDFQDLVSLPRIPA